MAEQRVVLITGSRKGIGASLAAHSLKRGDRTIGCSRGSSELTHPDYTHFQLDVADEAAVMSMFRDIRSEFGAIDVLINNAGVASMNHAMLTPLRTAEKIFDTNVIGTFLMCREAAKLMRRKGFGRIVNLTTVAVPMKLEGEALYASSKSAVITLTQILAKEFAEFGITVNAVGPSPVATDLVRGVPQDKIEAIVERQHIQEWAQASDVANVIDFFAKPESRFVTGQVIYLGGF